MSQARSPSSRPSGWSVRTFAKKFERQYQKKFDTIDIVGTNRIRPDSSYQAVFSRGKQTEHGKAFRDPQETKWYHANRGLDSSAFADPSNFVSRQKKYENGLHDLSASLLNKDIGLFDQIHNKEEGAFFAFLPLPEMEDQALLYKLTRAFRPQRAHLLNGA